MRWEKSLGVKFALALTFPACVGVDHKKMRIQRKQGLWHQPRQVWQADNFPHILHTTLTPLFPWSLCTFTRLPANHAASSAGKSQSSRTDVAALGSPRSRRERRNSMFTGCLCRQPVLWCTRGSPRLCLKTTSSQHSHFAGPTLRIVSFLWLALLRVFRVGTWWGCCTSNKSPPPPTHRAQIKATATNTWRSRGE